MPEFSHSDFAEWLRRAWDRKWSVNSFLAHEYCMDGEKCKRAKEAFVRWIERGCVS